MGENGKNDYEKKGNCKILCRTFRN